MSSYTTDRASPFTRAAVSSMRKLYPEALADKSFDNTGLLLEAPFDPIRRQMNSVLLTVDLTKAVADEAIERKDCVVVAYHPVIFKGIKSLVLDNTQQQSLLRLALEGISVYSPHTAVDAAPGGLGDWLADIVTGTVDANPEPETHTAGPTDNPSGIEKSENASLRSVPEDGQPPEEARRQQLQDDAPKDADPAPPPPKPKRPGLASHRTYSSPTYPKPSKSQSQSQLPTLKTSSISHTRSVIHPLPPSTSIPPNSGMGRLVRFDSPQPLTHLIERIARGVGSPKGFPVAIPQTSSVEDIQIKSCAICAGSGASVLKDTDADLLFTGELSHHEALSATEQGKCVVTLFHSNTERGYLSAVMKPKIEEVLREEWERVRGEEEPLGREGWEEAIQDESILVECSERDRDPFGIVILQSSEQVGKPLS